MKRILLIGLCLIVWALSTSVKAGDDSDERGFSHRITGSATLTDGDTIDINMLIGFQRSNTRGWYFRVGSDYVLRDTPPRAYYLNFILDGDGNAYVLDITDQPISHLTLTVEGREIELSQDRGSEITFGMRLRIDDRQFLFDNTHPRVRFDLTEQGLENIVAEHTLRDLSIRRSQ